jgi:radical SAM/Cys-rich protein
LFMAIETFKHKLIKHGLEIRRARTTTLQINVGFLCNQMCKHCHLDAGPDRSELMTIETMNEVVAYARRGDFQVGDITGGSPELNPNLEYLISGLSPHVKKIMVRSNLSFCNNGGMDLAEFYKQQRVVIVTSFPSLNQSQTESQRGAGRFGKLIDGIRKLNALGYGHVGTGLELNLVSNPTGAFLPAGQDQTEKRFHEVLNKRWGIVFNRLHNFANVPVGRFLTWLNYTGNLDAYMERLASAFNPCAVNGLMCRELVSVSWDGLLYDCDFNLAIGLPMGGRKIHVSDMAGRPEEGLQIAVGDHCYTCTAGAGFT